MIIQKETKEELIRYKGGMKGEKKEPKTNFRRDVKEKEKMTHSPLKMWRD